MTTVTLSAEDLELARRIGLRRGYLAERRPALRSLSLSTWYRLRASLTAELSDLEQQAIARHGSVAALLAAAFGGPVSPVCIDDAAHGASIPARHCGCFACRLLDHAASRP